jgi:type I restriction enzyme S subunit
MSERLLTWGEYVLRAPAGWRSVKLEEVLRNRTEVGRQDLPLLSVTDKGGVVYRDTLDRRDTSNEDKSKYKRVVPGDIAYNTMRMWQGRSGLSTVEGIVSPAYTVVTPEPNTLGTYLRYLFKFGPLIARFRAMSQGLVDDTLSLRFQELARISVPIPPISEQREIVAILSSTDEVIEKTEGVIQQLQIVKQAVMQELLTRGLPGRHVRFKKTELGEIPQDWQVATVKAVGDVAYGLTVNAERREASLRRPYLTVANLQEHGFVLDEVKDIGVLEGDEQRYGC